jgi:hypothetical protein
LDNQNLECNGKNILLFVYRLLMSIVFDYRTKSLFVVVDGFVDGFVDGDVELEFVKRTMVMKCNYSELASRVNLTRVILKSDYFEAFAVVTLI